MAIYSDAGGNSPASPSALPVWLCVGQSNMAQALVTGGAASWFSDTLKAAGKPIAIVPCAIGSTSITTWRQGGSSWDLTIEPLIGKVVPVGVFYWQGEADAVGAMAKATYKAHLAALIGELRNAFGTALDVLVTELQYFSDDPAAHVAIREAQTEVTEEVAGTFLVETVDLTEEINDTHPTAAYDEIGQRAAAIAAELLA